MNRFAIAPRWTLREEANREQQTLPVLLQLLAAIHEEATLTKACGKLGLSYRHAWGIIKDGAQSFGAPLVHFTRGEGAKLTTLGEKLMWADRRIVARLSPILETIAAELEAEIERARSDSEPVLRIQASHGYAVAALRDLLSKRRVRADLQFCGSLDALISLSRSNCELAGFHIPKGSLQSVALKHYAKWLRPRAQKLISVVTRRQGIMVVKGNPRGITSLADVARSRARFANRQQGSGTRLLLEMLLKKEKVNSQRIIGYESVEFTHDAVAAYIASGMADAGLGVEAAARKFGLDFVPLLSERYFLACRAEAIGSAPIRQVLSVLRGNEFKVFVNTHQGLDSGQSGTVMSIGEAFPDLPPLRGTSTRRQPKG